MNVWRNFAKALLAAKPDKDTRRDQRLGVIGIAPDGREFSSRNLSSKDKCPPAHAEYRLCKKLPPGSTIFIARAMISGNIGMAMPCPRCRLALKNARVKRAYFTTNDSGVYGIMEFNK